MDLLLTPPGAEIQFFFILNIVTPKIWLMVATENVVVLRLIENGIPSQLSRTDCTFFHLTYNHFILLLVTTEVLQYLRHYKTGI